MTYKKIGHNNSFSKKNINKKNIIRIELETGNYANSLTQTIATTLNVIADSFRLRLP